MSKGGAQVAVANVSSSSFTSENGATRPRATYKICEHEYTSAVVVRPNTTSNRQHSL